MIFSTFHAKDTAAIQKSIGIVKVEVFLNHKTAFYEI